MLVSSPRIVAGLDEVSPDVSCGNDVEDALALELEEPVDNPGTTISTKFSVLHWVLLPFGLNVVSDHWSPHMNIRVLRRVFPAIRLQAYPRELVLSRINQDRGRTLWLPHSFALFHWL